MRLDLAKSIAETLVSRGITARVRDVYSRGMFFVTTAAVILESNFDVREAMRICPELVEADLDALGLGAIFY